MPNPAFEDIELGEIDEKKTRQNFNTKDLAQFHYSLSAEPEHLWILDFLLARRKRRESSSQPNAVANISGKTATLLCNPRDLLRHDRNLRKDIEATNRTYRKKIAEIERTATDIHKRIEKTIATVQQRIEKATAEVQQKMEAAKKETDDAISTAIKQVKNAR